MHAEPLELATPSRVHVVGIGGAGMGGLASLLERLGHTVSGSDLTDSATLAVLREGGISIAIGHDARNVGPVDLVTYSPAVPADNVELVEAARRRVRVATRAEVLAALSAMRETLAVAGTHGKTTTATMLTVILDAAGRSPSWLVGAAAAGQGVNARLGTGPELVLEADESYGTIAQLAPTLCALINVEPDHLDHYGDFASLKDAFEALLERSDTRVVNADDPVAAELGARTGATTVGAAHGADVVIGDVHLDRASSSFVLHHAGASVAVRVGAPGAHNVHNAALAAAVALVRDVDPDVVGASLARFAGVPRRYEFRGEVGGATIVDDYAHLAGEVAATVAAARAGGFRRVIAVFQPHRYTRTQALAAGFAGAFDGADVVVVTDVYGAGEPPRPGVTGRLVADAVAAGPHAPEVRYVKDRTELAAAVLDLAGEGDLILTMGAGDLTTLADELRAVRT